MTPDPVSQAAPAPGSASAPAASKRGGPRGWRKWLFRLLAVVAVPAAVLGLLELGLRAFGYGRPTAFFLDGATVASPGMLVENRQYGQRFFPASLKGAPPPLPVAIPARKPAGTYRVFVLGESAAMGFPDPSAGFARVLEVMLRERCPGAKVEVVNTAMVAMNSNVVRLTAQECARHEPDLFVVLLGNNEVVGPFGAAGVLGGYAPSRPLIRANLAVKATRVGQLLHSMVRGAGADPGGPAAWKGMATFADSHVRADDPRLPVVRDHFRRNLEDICDAGAGAGVPVVVCTVPVNLRDSAPFGSAPVPEAAAAAWDAAYQAGVAREAAGDAAGAVTAFDAAAALDAGHADLHFRLGRCHATSGNPAAAVKHFAAARDLDTLRFRADAALNAAVRDVVAAKAGGGAVLADAEQVFAAESPGGAPGEDFFLEHVHFNFKGNVLLARTVFLALRGALPAWVRPAADAPPTERECAAKLAQTEWNELRIHSQIRAMFRSPPFANQLDRDARDARWDARLAAQRARLPKGGLEAAVAAHEAAVAQADGDWMLRMNFGRLLTEVGAPAKAAEQYEAAVKILSHNFPALYQLGRARLDMGDEYAALRHFRAALKFEPEYTDAQFGVAEALAAMGKTDDALAACDAPMKAEANRPAGLVLQGNILAKAGRFAEARDKFEAALPAAPDPAAVHAFLGDLALAQGRPAAAVPHYEAALTARPDWPPMAEHLAKVRQAVKDGKPPGK